MLLYVGVDNESAPPVASLRKRNSKTKRETLAAGPKIAYSYKVSQGFT